MRSVWRCYGALATAALLGPTSSPSSYPPSTSSAWSPHLTSRHCSARHLCIDAQCGCTHRRLNRTFVATTAWTAARRWWRRLPVSTDVEMIGLSVQTAAMKLQWCVSPIDVLPTFSRHVTSQCSFCWHRSARQGECAAHPRVVHISP